MPDAPTHSLTLDSSGQSPAGVAAQRRSGWVDPSLLLFCGICIVIAAGAAAFQIAVGAYRIPLGAVLQSLFSPDVWADPDVWLALLLGIGETPLIDKQTTVVWTLRVPRVVSGAMVGVCLSISGAIFQAVTRNELASPYILGISSGAGLAILLTLIVFPAAMMSLPILAAGGGVVAFFLVYAIAWKGGVDPIRLVLAGVIVGTIFGSLQTAVLLLADDVAIVKSALDWTTGSLTGNDWQQVRMILPWTVLTLGLSLFAGRQLNLMLLGDATAKSLGMSVQRVRFLLCLLAIAAASASVAVAGIIGFVGLIIPHVVRTCLGSDYRRVIVGCLFAGPALMTFSDLIARLAMNPVQIPVGIVTGVVGGAYFLYLMRRRREVGKV
jgi:iron complex transport system permease protein